MLNLLSEFRATRLIPNSARSNLGSVGWHELRSWDVTFVQDARRLAGALQHSQRGTICPELWENDYALARVKVILALGPPDKHNGVGHELWEYTKLSLKISVHPPGPWTFSLGDIDPETFSD